MCNCIAILNAELAPHNAMVVTTMLRRPDVPVIATTKIDSKKRGKPPLALATFCPFCGEEYAGEGQ